MRKIFVFSGDPMTGKSTLANLINNNKTQIVDDFNPGKASCHYLIDYLTTNKFDYNNFIVICHSSKTDELLHYLKKLDNKRFEISVVRFEQL